MDKTHIIHEIADARAAVDEVGRSKASAEKSHKNLLNTLNEQAKKIEEANLNLNDIEGHKKKISGENADLLRQLQEMENSANMLAKLKHSLGDQLSEARAVADNEAKERQSLLGKFRNAEHEVAGMKDHYEEEVASKENIGRQLNKALGEADMLRVKYEKEGLAKAEELEMAKLKMQARLSEAESTSRHRPSCLIRRRSSMGPWRRRPSSLTGLSANGRARWTASAWTWTPPRRKPATHLLTSSV